MMDESDWVGVVCLVLILAVACLLGGMLVGANHSDSMSKQRIVEQIRVCGKTSDPEGCVKRLEVLRQCDKMYDSTAKLACLRIAK